MLTERLEARLNPKDARSLPGLGMMVHCVRQNFVADGFMLSRSMDEPGIKVDLVEIYIGNRI